MFCRPANEFIVIPLALVGLLLIPTATVFGQPIPQTFDSLEAKLARSEMVVLGTIDRLSTKRFASRGRQTLSIDIKVDEVLRGNKKTTQVTNVSRSVSLYDKRFDEWAKEKTQILWFISKRKAPDAPAETDVLRIGKEVPSEKSIAPSYAAPLFSANLKWIENAEDAMQVARDYCKKHNQPYRVTYFRIPPSICRRCDPGVHWHTVIIPVDPSLEKMSQRLIRDPQKYFSNVKLTPDDLYKLSHEALDSLQSFKSEENAKLIENLLDAPRLDLPKRNDFFKPLPTVAFQILEQWGKSPRVPAIASKITSLTLRGKSIDDRTLSKLASMRKLHTLFLFNTSVTAQGLSTLAELPSLTKVDLDPAMMTDEVISQLFDSNLIHRVSWAQTGDDEKRPRSFDEVEYFAVPQSKWISVKSLDHILKLKNLEILDLRNAKLSNDSIAKLGQFKKLKWLWIGGTKINDAGVKKLKELLPDCKIRR